MTLPAAVQGDDCLPPLPQHSLLHCWLTALQVCCSLHCQHWHSATHLHQHVEQWRQTSLHLQNQGMSGNSVPCISSIPRSTVWPPSPVPSSATFLQVFIVLSEGRQAHVLIPRESLAVQAGRPGVAVAAEHGGAALTDSSAHTPARMDEPGGGNTRLS